MRIYAETNFLVELAREQDQAEACEEIVRRVEENEATLILPAFSLTEASNALDLHQRTRKEAAESITRTIANERRTSSGEQYEVARNALLVLLLQSNEYEANRLHDLTDRLIKVCTWIELTSTIALDGRKLEQRFKLRPFDAVVLAAVLSHLRASPAEKCCFVNSNKNDFNHSDIRAELAVSQCKLLTDFESAKGYLRTEA
jgi:predicted nucleic acid-binding protein